jgi:hypothetical protein
MPDIGGHHGRTQGFQPRTVARCQISRLHASGGSVWGQRFVKINLREREPSRFEVQNLADTSIDNANISGLTIFGWNITDLIKQAQQRKNSN